MSFETQVREILGKMKTNTAAAEPSILDRIHRLTYQVVEDEFTSISKGKSDVILCIDDESLSLSP